MMNLICICWNSFANPKFNLQKLKLVGSCEIWFANAKLICKCNISFINVEFDD
jgi:hypothetical protein